MERSDAPWLLNDRKVLQGDIMLLYLCCYQLSDTLLLEHTVPLALEHQAMQVSSQSFLPTSSSPTPDQQELGSNIALTPAAMDFEDDATGGCLIAQIKFIRFICYDQTLQMAQQPSPVASMEATVVMTWWSIPVLIMVRASLMYSQTLRPLIRCRA